MDDTTKTILESANKWAEIGRDALNKSIEAIKEGRFASSESYSRAASEAFDKELALLLLLVK